MMEILSASIICMIFMVVVMGPINIHANAGQGIERVKIERPSEVVVILDQSASTTDQDFEGMVNVTRSLPDYFVISETRTRLAIITYSGAPYVELNLTSHADLIRSRILPRRSKDPVANLHLALKDAKEKIFNNARQQVKRIAVLFTDGKTRDQPSAEKVAEELRVAGCFIYVIIPRRQYEDPNIKHHIDRITGDASRVSSPDGFSNMTKDIFDGVPDGLDCEFEVGCRFDGPDGTKCTSAWWRPFLNMAIDCKNKQPDPPTDTCLPDSCEKTCDKWPWDNDHTCKDEDAGKNKVVNRQKMPKFNEHMYKNCPSKKELDIYCPPKSKSTGQPVQTSKPKEEGADDDKTVTGLSAETELLVIILGVVIVCLCLILVVVAVLVSIRKRKKPAEVVKKAAVVKSSPKASMKESIKKPEAPTSAQIDFGFEKKMGAERAVAADLLEKEKSVGGQSKSSVSMKSAGSVKKDVSIGEKSKTAKLSMKGK